MKKVLVIAVLTACMLSVASAQESFKPKAGDFSLEVGFVPFGQKIINEADLAGFIHFNSRLALRIGLEFGFDSDIENNGETGSALLRERRSEFKFG
jgi:hypothetical protein